jgi:hypothetical protein
MNRMLLVLKRSPEQEFGLHKLLDDQQDKSSPNFHKWLTPGQFGAQFGPSDQDVQLITGWLHTHGFQVNRISKGRSVIEFSGMESQVEEAFHTPIHKYLGNGEEHWANANDPQIPAALTPAVAGVWSLHDFRKKPKLSISQARIPILANGPFPLLTNHGQHALMPADFATIYNVSPLYAQGIAGQGATIAVVARSNIYITDVFNFRSLTPAPSYGPVNVVNDGPDPGTFDLNEEFEANLDTSWSGAIAPGATVNLVISASTNTTDGVDLSELYIVDNNLGDVMTESFGSCEGFASSAEAQGLSTLAEQAAAEGITYTVSSGDSGAEGCVDPSGSSANGSQPSVNVLASSAYTVAVGGTMFNENNNSSVYWNSTNSTVNLSSAKSYIPEDVWNESCVTCGLWSGGGGASVFFSKPNWQYGVVGIPSDGARDIPDVSLNAAGEHDPYLICFHGSCSQSFYGVGGTSASAPSFAGIMALAVEQHGRQGQANYVLYRLAAVEKLSDCNASNTAVLPASTCIFNDVTTGNNAVPGELNYGSASALYQAGLGYDLATGLGSVNAANLVNQWNTVQFSATSTTLGPSSIAATHGSPVTLNVTVSPGSAPGIPSGDVSLQTGSYNRISPGFLTLSNGSVTAPVSNLPGGFYTLTARYGGDATFAPSISSGIPVNISPEDSTTSVSVFVSDQSGNLTPFTTGSFGQLIYPRVDVVGQSGNGTPTGNVYLFDTNQFSAVPLGLNSQGNAGLPHGNFFFAAGQHSLTASYHGDQSFKASTSSPAIFTITPATTSLTLSSQTAAQVGAVTFQASITSPAFIGFAGTPTYPSGAVSFWNGKTQIDSVPVTANGSNTNGITAVATLTTSSLPAGTDTITAQYSGDTNYASSSASIIVTIHPDFNFSFYSTSVPVGSGNTATNLLTISGVNAYSGTVNFTSASCAGLPSLTTCSFSPASVTGSGSTTLTIKTTAPSSAAIRSPATAVLGFVFAGALLVVLPARRARSWHALSVVAFALAATCGVACGGGNSGSGNGVGGGGNPGTPRGTYTVTVTATTGDQALSHTASFTLVVQ